MVPSRDEPRPRVEGPSPSEASPIGKYVHKVYDACGDGRDFVIILKQANREEALRKVLERCKVDHSISTIFTKADFGGREVSIFKTGKLVIKGLGSRQKAEEVLAELLS